MSEFLVEVYVSRITATLGTPKPEEILGAAEQVSREGRPVRLLRSFFVPDEETYFYVFQAQTGDAVRDAVARAGLRCDRVVEVVGDWQKTAVVAPDRAVSTQRNEYPIQGEQS